MSSNNNLNLIIAKEKGYYSDILGNIYSPFQKLNLIKTNSNTTPYYVFGVRYKNKVRIIMTHRFIAYLKFGDKIFDEGIVVRHLNSNSLDNSYENILLGTHTDNMRDKSKNVTVKAAIIAASKNRRFSDNQVMEIIFDRKNDFSYKKLCEKYNTSKGTLSYFFNKAYYSGARKIEDIID